MSNYTAGDLIPFFVTPKSGSAPTLQLKRLSDGYYLDFNDNTWKNSAWTTKTKTLTDGTNQWKYTWDSTGLDGDDSVIVMAEYTVGTQVFTDQFTINYARDLKAGIKRLWANQFRGCFNFSTPVNAPIFYRINGTEDPIVSGSGNTLKFYGANWSYGLDGSMELGGDTLLLTLNDGPGAVWETFAAQTFDVVYAKWAGEDNGTSDLWVDFPSGSQTMSEKWTYKFKILAGAPAGAKILTHAITGECVVLDANYKVVGVPQNTATALSAMLGFVTQSQAGGYTNQISVWGDTLTAAEGVYDGTKPIDDSITLMNLYRALTAIAVGLTTGGNSANTIFYRQDGTTEAINMTVNGVGDRSSVVTNLG